MRFLPKLFLLLLASSLPALGFSLRVLPWDEQVAERKLSIVHGSTVEDIGYLHPGARSKAIKIPADAVGLRLDVNDRKGADGKPLPVKLRVPAGLKTALLLILPDEKSKAGVRGLIIEDDVSSFQWGTIRLINVTPKPVVFRWDKKAKTIAPGWKPVSISPGGKSRNLEVFLYLKDDLKKPLYSSIWEHRSNMRQLVFMVPSSNTALGPVEFKIVPELRIEEEAP
ncbi:hypothetical protein [Haloferula sp.]|uniref:hypothetical protein n=1 Tax=Haloferula sp. TaxID=2497595 RepID=UPI00329D99A1